MRRLLIAGSVAWIGLAACQNPAPAPVPSPSDSLSPSVPMMTPFPSPTTCPPPPVPRGEAPRPIYGIDRIFLLPNPLNFRPSPDRRVRMVLSATSPVGGEHHVYITEGSPAPTAYQVTSAPDTWPFQATPRWHAERRMPSRQLAQAGGERAVGSEETFWITTGTFKPETDEQRVAMLRRITAHAFFYVDKTSSRVSDADLNALAEEFESRIYPGVTGVFGTESRPGVDGEDRLFIVITPAFSGSGNLLGYFWARDAVPAAQAEAHSNRKEVLFMADRLLTAARLQRHGVLAHELQHLINFTRKGPRLGYTSQEATWLDEGMSMLAMDLAGYGLQEGDQLTAKDIVAYQQAPEAYSLTDWASNPNGQAFGQNYLFMRYAVDRFGEALLRELIDTERVGIEALDAVLEKHGTTFDTVFQDWAIANLLQGRGPAPYRYESVDLTGSYAGQRFTGFKTRPLVPGKVVLKSYGSAFFDSPGGVSAFGLNRQSTSFLGAVTQD